jgi:putative salt-induced outer membrane protein YdiY
MTLRGAGAAWVVCLLALPAMAADQVVLKNGDTITGAIVRKDGDKLTLKSEFLGEVTMPWSAVKSIRSDTDLHVELATGEKLTGKLAGTAEQVEVAAAGATKTTPMAAVKTVRDDTEQKKFERMEHPGLLELWTGNFDFGLALARGNSRSDTLTTAFMADRSSRNDKLAVYFNQIRGTARVNGATSTIASAVRGGWKYNRNFSSRFFASAFDDYEHDRFQNLDLRIVAGGGLGVRAIKRGPAQFDVDGGIDYQRENFFTPPNRNSAEANVGDSLLYKLSKATTLTQSMRMFANLTDAGVYRLNFDIGGSTTIRKWLGWHVTASDRFVSNPVAGRQRNDLIVSTGFRLSFAR